MKSMTFDATLALGVPEVDDQHRELVALYNEMVAAVDQRDDRCHIIQILNHLTQFAVDHCIAEEALMEQAGFPGLSAHRQAHDAGARAVFEFDAVQLLESEAAAKSLLAIIRRWLCEHIDADRELAGYCHHAYASAIGW